MQPAHKFKRPCEQCKAELTYGHRNGTYAEGYSGLQHANCCGSWAVSIKGGKVQARRPTLLELGRLGLR